MPTTEYGVDQFFQNAGTSPKMVYDVAGVLGWSPHNLVQQSKDATFGNVTNVTVTSNVAAGPDGDMTADQLALAGGNGSFFYMPAIATAIAGATYCGTVWLKASAPVQIAVRTTSGDGSGTPGVVLAAVTTTWQKFSTFCIAGTTSAINVGLDHRTFVSGDDGLAKTVIAADWQINRGTTPTAYLPTTTAARVGLALDYDPVTHAAKGLLCEPQATNLVTQSAGGNVFPPWTIQSTTVTASAQADPMGGLSASQVVITPGTGPTAGNNYSQNIASLTNGSTYTASVWLKGTAGQQMYFSANTSQAGAHNTLVTFTGAWQRVTSTVAVNATSAWMACECYNRGGGAHLPAITFHAWGWQYEAGTVATSHIPTLAATVTRAADQPSVTPASINYSATAGSWWVDLSLNAVGSGGTDRVIGYQNGGNTPIFVSSATAFALFDGTAFVSKTVSNATGAHKVIAAFASADKAITADGLVPATDAAAGAALLTPGTTIGIGQGVVAFGMNGYIRKVRYLPRRPTNAELQTMTT